MSSPGKVEGNEGSKRAHATNISTTKHGPPVGAVCAALLIMVIIGRYCYRARRKPRVGETAESTITTRTDRPGEAWLHAMSPQEETANTTTDNETAAPQFTSSVAGDPIGNRAVSAKQADARVKRAFHGLPCGKLCGMRRNPHHAEGWCVLCRVNDVTGTDETCYDLGPG